ncbi:hypothetical protein RI844_05720 [Thalassotalea fonticola]|uniref:Dystroglycan-type cadherin-like domain-containing protein n=1 Tax=Thalassotalea fonticola TaxID=3065649 RepID=A0ABZ0GRY8_9GAMM|nr:hypothetical protein RI844_05720 [Colwelliaceae bacterium S1-1]
MRIFSQSKFRQPYIKLRLVPVALILLACNVGVAKDTDHATFLNHAPSLPCVMTTKGVEGDQFITALTATDVDGDSLKFMKTDGVDWLTISENVLKGQPGAEHIGSNEITISVSDGVDTVAATFNISIVAALNSTL